MTRPDRRAVLAGTALVFGAASLWATFGLFAKALYARGYTPLELASVRAFVGFAGAAVLAPARLPELRIRPRDVPFFAFYGIAGFALFEFLYLATLDRTSVSVAVSLLYTAPTFVLLMAPAILRERIDAPRLLALALVIIGVVLVTGAFASTITGSIHVTRTALALGLGSGLTYGLYTVTSKLALARTSPWGAMFWSFLFASLAFAIPAQPISILARDSSSLPLLLGLGIVPTLLAYLAYLLGLEYLRATTAAMIASTEPVIAATLGTAFLAEHLSLDQLLGILAIVAASILAARRETVSPTRQLRN